MVPAQQCAHIASPVVQRNVLVLASQPGGAHEIVRSVLQRRGYNVDLTDPALSTLDDVDRYDLLVLEIDVRDEESVQFCVQLRKVSLVPLLVLVPETARSQGIQALQLGADNFVLVPFSRQELVARSEALIRRYRRAWSRLQPG